MRRLHGAGGWCSQAFLPASGWFSGREKDHNHRRVGGERKASSAAAGLSGFRRDAMRVLHFRNDYVRPRSAENQRQPQTGRNHQPHERQYLPLRNVSANHRGDSKGRESDEGGGQMTKILPPEISIEPE